jgi:hypothetical protein
MIVSAAIMTTYVRRWERGTVAPTERYRLLCCTVLGVPLPSAPAIGQPSPALAGSVGQPSVLTLTISIHLSPGVTADITSTG